MRTEGRTESPLLFSLVVNQSLVRLISLKVFVFNETHIRYIKIQAWNQGFVVKVVYLLIAFHCIKSLEQLPFFTRKASRSHVGVSKVGYSRARTENNARCKDE